MQTFERITVHPNIMGGRPSVRGMRITVGLVVNLVANVWRLTKSLLSTRTWRHRMFGNA